MFIHDYDMIKVGMISKEQKNLRSINMFRINRCSWVGLDKMYHGKHTLMLFGMRLFTWNVNRKSNPQDWGRI